MSPAKEKLKVIKGGVVHFLKNCLGGCGTWLYRDAERRCPICGCGLVRAEKGKT